MTDTRRLTAFAFAALALVACGKKTLDRCSTPTAQSCTPATDGFLTTTQLQASCPSGKACITDGAGGGFCVTDTFARFTGPDGGAQVRPFTGFCNACGACQFHCGGIAGFQCPSNCVAAGPAPGCCDQMSTCFTPP